LHLIKIYPERISDLKKIWKEKQELDFTGLTFPMKINDITKFEKLNKLTINIFEWDYKK
jgi:hypothetical protein